MLKIKNGMFVDQFGRYVLFLFGWVRDKVKMPINAIAYTVSGIINNDCPYDEKFNIRPEWKHKFKKAMDGYKKDGLYVLLQPFSALWFRKQASGGRSTKVKTTRWWTGDLESSREFFFSKSQKAQFELFCFMIDYCREIKLDFAFSLLWEAQTIAWYQPFYSWFRDHKARLKERYEKDFPVGLHSHNAKQTNLADFLVLEGNGIDELIHEPISKPVLYFKKNPGKWPVGNPENYSVGYNSKNVKHFAIRETISELIKYGCSAVLFDRWWLKDVMSGDVKADLSEYDFKGMERVMRTFYGIVVGRLKNANRRYTTQDFCLDLLPAEEKPKPKPEPEPEPEKDKKTEPISVVEKEVKMNFFKKNWKVIKGALLRTLHGWLIPIYGVACKYIHINGFILFVIGIVLALIVLIIEEKVYG